jgi:glycosyltransferase involved in cell wall biosynthesis
MSHPEITVVIPVWNRDKELRECVASIKAQKVPHRILLVNNASDSPLPKFQGVKELTLPKRTSIGQARNAGLAAVTTKYVYFMDADDLLLPDALEHVYRRITAEPGCVLAASGLYDWNPVTDNKKLAPLPRRYTIWIHRWRALFGAINAIRYSALVVGSALLDADAARRVGGFPDINYGEDWAFSAGLVFQGPVSLDQHPIKLYRMDPGETTLVSGISKWGLSTKFRRAMKEVRHNYLHAPNVPLRAKLLFPFVVVGQNLFYVKKMIRQRRKV